ncbi:unnamed protein product, partial [Meganyctiphanes norvegica]
RAMGCWGLAVCVCATIVGLCGVSARDPLTINTLSGKVKGKTFITSLGKEVDAWYGIPYAKPPIGDLRFRHPQPIDKWHNVKETIHQPNSCIQINDTFFGDFPATQQWNPNTRISEDCLYLSVVVPKPRPINSAVMLWIYGGGFYSGTSTLDIYDLKMLAAEQNVIVVAIQYRVASLGFLYMGSSDVPGNAGMFDQLLGLKWAKDNIKYFGGNPNNITIFGESAGAVSVSMHLLSPLSRNLFNQAIMQSGSATAPWAVISKQESILRGLRLAEAVNCPHDKNDMPAVIKCLREQDGTDLVSNEPAMPICDFPFVPIVDGAFLDDLPTKSLAKGNFKKTNILMGSNTEEGNWFIVYYLPDLFPRQENVKLNRIEFESSVRELFPYFNDLVHQAIMFEYTDWMDPEDGESNRDAVDKMVGDYQFTCNVNEFAYNYANTGNNVFMYYFKHRATTSLWPKWMGTLHGDDIMYLFGTPLRANSNFTLEEQELTRRMMTYWANFAKTGNPVQSDDGGFESVSWPVHTAGRREFLTLSTTSTDEGRGPRLKKCAFWKNFVPQLLKLTANKHPPRHPEQCPSSTNGGNRHPTMEVTIAVFMTLFSTLLYSPMTRP